MISGIALEQSHLKAFRERHCRAGEDVIGALSGYRGKMFGKGDDAQRNGVLIVTSQRVVFYRKGLLGETLETFPIEKVTSVETSATMGARRMVIHTSHDSLSFGSMEARVAFDEVRSLIERLRSPADQTVQTTVPTAIAPDPGEKLRKLTELYQDGIITESEFREKRSALVARL